MLLGQARGKVGDLVFYVRNGSQQTRPRNRQPANPQTRRQMAQRVKLGAPVGFYKRQAKFFQFAFKKKEKESFYNAFMRYNMNIGAYLTREEVVDGYKSPAPYIIADGNMPSVSVMSATNITDHLQLRLSIPATSAHKWGDIRQRYGLLYGDMMTIVVFDTQSYKESLVNRIVIQHVFDAASDNSLIGYDMGGTMWSAVSGYYTVDIDAQYFGMPQFNYNGSAVVLSRNNGNIDCSFAQLTLNDLALEEYESRRTAEALELAITSYADIDDVILDPMSADENEAEFVQLFNDSALTEVLNEVTAEQEDNINVYYDTSKLGSVNNVRSSVISGNLTGVVAAYSSAGQLALSANATASGSGVLSIKFFDTALKPIGIAKLAVTIV